MIENDGLKILSAEITNFKNLSHMEVDFDNGRSMMVVGSNDKGKSSFIQALMCAFNDQYMPMEPIKKGEERGSVQIKIGGKIKGEEKLYTVELYFTPEKKKGRLVLLDSEGRKVPSPSSALDGIIGNISFDIDEFISLSKTKGGAFSKEGALKQVEILKGLMPKEAKKELFYIDTSIQELKSKKTEINSKIKTYKEQKKHEYSDDDLERYKDIIPTAPIEEKLKKIGDDTQKYSRAETAKADLEKAIAAINKDIASGMSYETAKHNYEALINFEESLEGKNDQTVSTFMVHLAGFKKKIMSVLDMVASLPKLQSDLEKTNAWLSKNTKPTADLILKELDDANKHNNHHNEVNRIKSLFVEIKELEKSVENIDEKIEELKNRKKEIFASNVLPVKGLSFDEEQVLYKGLPFDHEQHPASTIIGVGVKIAMAMNPNLKVIVIKDGSLLDQKITKGILEMIQKYGYQLFIEMVSYEEKPLQLNFIEKDPS